MPALLLIHILDCIHIFSLEHSSFWSRTNTRWSGMNIFLFFPLLSHFHLFSLYSIYWSVDLWWNIQRTIWETHYHICLLVSFEHLQARNGHSFRPCCHLGLLYRSLQKVCFSPLFLVEPPFFDIYTRIFIISSFNSFIMLSSDYILTYHSHKKVAQNGSITSLLWGFFPSQFCTFLLLNFFISFIF